jgi:naphthoate synthase
LLSEGPSSKDGVYFCSGGDQNARGHQGYVEDGQHRLNILEERLICFMPKVVIAVVPGWAVGGGHSLHVVCDLTLASKEHAILQTDADVTFDGGYGSAYLAKKGRAREIFFFRAELLCSGCNGYGDGKCCYSAC